MNADTIVQQLLEMRNDTITKSELIEIDLQAPSDHVIRCILDAGGTIGIDKWYVWCNSDTCAHNSHDPGQSVTLVAVPKSWILSNRDIDDISLIFDMKRDIDNKPLMIIPNERPTLVYKNKQRHRAAYTRTAKQL